MVVVLTVVVTLVVVVKLLSVGATVEMPVMVKLVRDKEVDVSRWFWVVVYFVSQRAVDIKQG